MTDQITAAELAEIEARATTATPGPWIAEEDGLVWANRLGDPVSGSTEMENADFIAAARTDVPRLVAALRAAYAQLRAYESAICFEVTCTGCAKQLDALATAEAERDQAKAELAAAVVEWGEWWPDGDVVDADDREQAQRWVNVNGPNHKVVRRRVTEWQPIEEGVDRG